MADQTTVISPSSDLFVTTHDLGLGLARRLCPYCDMPLIIRLPSMKDAIADRESAALRLGMTTLSPSERVIFDTVYAHFPRAVSSSVVRAALGDLSQNGTTTLVWRLRPKIRRFGWELLSPQGSGWMRLVEPTHVVDLPEPEPTV